MSVQRTIDITQRLRPIRLGFLTHGMDDRPAVRTWILINTCLWGGVYNPLIPVYQQRPNWWSGSQNGRDITEGYIDAFEPDYLVAEREDLFQGLSVPEDRTIHFDRLLDGGAVGPFRVGLGVQHLYEHLYEKRFRFKQRSPKRFVLTTPATSGLTDLLRCCFGEFPDFDPINRFRDEYKFVFEAVEVAIDHSNYLSLFSGSTSFPLRIGSSELSVQTNFAFGGLRIFVLDPTASRDIIDYWNLRAIGWEIIPIPHKWIERLAPDIQEAIKDVFRPDNHLINTRVLISRSLDQEATREKIDASWSVTKRRALQVRTHYPRIWDSWARPKDHAKRCTVTASQKRDTLPIEDGRLSFEGVDLPLESTRPKAIQAPWVEVISFSPRYGTFEVATDFPPELEGIGTITGARGPLSPWISSEGIVQPRFSSGEKMWNIPTGRRVFKKWFEQRGFEFEVSSAGKLAREAVARLGSIRRVAIIRTEETVRFLEGLAHGLPEIEIADAQELENLNRARGRIEKYQTVLGHFKKITENDRRAENLLSIFTDRRILRLGARLQCGHCDQHNWYRLEDLATHLECERCLQTYSFPLDKPPHSPWAYRAAGPFAVENYMQGAYTVLFAIRVLWDLSGMRKGVTWTPSFNLTYKDGTTLEADFAAFWKDQGRRATRERVVVGECKSFNEFQVSDVEKMRKLGEKVPGAVVAFCTLREELSDDEKKMIGRYAREQWAGYPESSANRILVLTGIELFSEIGVPYCWEGRGGKFDEYSDRGSVRSNLESLCNASQELHLAVDTAEQIQKAIEGRG